MKHKHHYTFYLVLAWFVLMLVDAAPMHPMENVHPCSMLECDQESGPVCGIDDSGLPRTFDNRCMAALAFCQYGTYIAEIRPGEC